VYVAEVKSATELNEERQLLLAAVRCCVTEAPQPPPRPRPGGPGRRARTSRRLSRELCSELGVEPVTPADCEVEEKLRSSAKLGEALRDGIRVW
jgi:hypothetical protein